MEKEGLSTGLSQPGFWPQSGPVELVETHISWVFLVGDRGYKVKKPVNFGFVDFTTLEKRRFFCEEEIRLNRRLAPDLYLGLRTITGSPVSPRFEGKGKAIDFAVEMRRFDHDELLVNIDQAGQLTERHMTRLARIMADFHKQTPSATATDTFGRPEEIARAVEENFHHLLRGNVPNDREKRLRRLRSWAQEEHSKRKALFHLRREAGCIRECHGDLHLGNIILRGDELTIFDCIEFNEELRWIDVLSDVAFCTMDLTSRGRSTLARQFLNVYLEETGDYAGVEVLPYYLSYRALVRAKVAWLKLADVSGEVKKELEEQCSKYLSLAEDYASRRLPRLILMHGLSGTGKSYGSSEIVRRIGAIRIRSDVERKRIASETDGSGLYSREMKERTYARLHTAADCCLRAGFSVVLDATYLHERERKAAFAVAEKLNVPCRLLNLIATKETLEERIHKRKAERTDPSEADLEVLQQQIRSLEPLTAGERKLTVDIDTDDPDGWGRTIDRLEAG